MALIVSAATLAGCDSGGSRSGDVNSSDGDFGSARAVVETDCSAVARIDTKAQLSIADMAKLGESWSPEVYTSTRGAIEVRKFSPRPVSEDGGWSAFGILYASLGGLAEREPAGVLWFRNDVKPLAEARYRMDSRGQHLALLPAGTPSCASGYTAHLDDQDVLSVGGTIVGAVEDIR